MQKNRRLRTLTFTLALTLTCFKLFAIPTPPSPAKEDDAVKVQTTLIQRKPVQWSRKFVGTVLYPRTRPQYAPLEGTVTRIRALPGSEVKKGHVVLEMIQTDGTQNYLHPFTARADVAGVLGMVSFAEGQYVKAGSLIFEVVTGDPQFQFFVPSFELNSISDQATFQIRSLTQSDQTSPVALLSTSPSPHPQWGAHQILLAPKKSQDQKIHWIRSFPPNSSVELVVQHEAKENFVIAQRHVTQIGGKYFVWTVDPQTKTALRTEVSVKSRIGHDFEVSLVDAKQESNEFSLIHFSEKKLTPGKKLKIEASAEETETGDPKKGS